MRRCACGAGPRLMNELPLQPPNLVFWLFKAPRGAPKGAACSKDGMASCLMGAVRTAQFDTILNEPSVIITQMRVNTCLP